MTLFGWGIVYFDLTYARAESRGPYSRPYTVYFIHTKTAFSVRGVCKRFSEFKEFDAKIRANFPNASLNLDFPSDQVASTFQNNQQALSPLARASPAPSRSAHNCPAAPRQHHAPV